uniref:Uncharacterized protein n=1 Tax=Arundo donax TaxID=35708 RepID=A0A0A9FIW5_ARUDO
MNPVTSGHFQLHKLADFSSGWICIYGWNWGKGKSLEFEVQHDQREDGNTCGLLSMG